VENKHVTFYQQFYPSFNHGLMKKCLDWDEFCDAHIRITVLHYKKEVAELHQHTCLLTCDRANWWYRYTPPMMPMLITNKAVRKRQTVVAVETRRARAFRIKYCGSAWAEASRSTLEG